MIFFDDLLKYNTGELKCFNQSCKPFLRCNLFDKKVAAEKWFAQDQSDCLLHSQLYQIKTDVWT